MDLGLKGLKGTGCRGSSGLGFATALELSNEGVLVAINGRDPGRLADAADRIQSQTGMTVFPDPGDLADPEFDEVDRRPCCSGARRPGFAGDERRRSTARGIRDLR